MFNNMNVIEAVNVDYYYAQHKALGNITLSFQRGKFYGLLGPNGSGKSTLLRLLSGTHRPAKGKMLLLGKQYRNIKIRDRARILSFVPQSFQIDFPFSCFEIVMMGRYAYQGITGLGAKKDEKIVHQCMEFTKTGMFSNRLITQLSGGEQQRVLLAQALAQESEILLLDEPTSHLDIRFQLETLRLLKRLNTERGLTIISSFHDLNLASGYCDYLYFISGGEILQHGPTENVFTEDIIKSTFQIEARIIMHPINNKPLVIYNTNNTDSKADISED